MVPNAGHKVLCAGDLCFGPGPAERFSFLFLFLSFSLHPCARALFIRAKHLNFKRHFSPSRSLISSPLSSLSLSLSRLLLLANFLIMEQLDESHGPGTESWCCYRGFGTHGDTTSAAVEREAARQELVAPVIAGGEPWVPIEAASTGVAPSSVSEASKPRGASTVATAATGEGLLALVAMTAR